MEKSHQVGSLFNCLLLVVSAGLAGCGGGGGSGSGAGGTSGGNNPPPPPVSRGFTASVASISRAASVAGDEPFGEEIQISITDTAANQFGFRATYTTNGIAYAIRHDDSLTSIRVSVGLYSPTQIEPGTYQDTIRLGFCGDAACTTFKGTTLEIPVTYKVTIGTLPTVSLASSTVDVSRLPWDVLTPPRVLVPVTVTPHTRYDLALTTSHTSDAIASLTYSDDANHVWNIIIELKPGAQLSPGVHTDVINVTACIEQACKYPLVVTPSTITVTYNVTATITGPQGFSIRHSPQAVADVAWSESRNTLYAAVPAQASSYPGNVVEFDPVTETVGGSLATGFDPSVLALSDDGSRLYVAQRNGDSIRRLITNPLASDILISLGNDPYPPGTTPMFATDMRVAPGTSGVLAVRRNTIASNGNGLGIVIFDETIQRPSVAQISPFSDWGNVAWDPDGTRLYTNGAVLSVGATGPVFASNLQQSSGRLRFINGRIYSDDAHIINPADPMSYVWYETLGQSRAAALDVAKNRAYFATQYSGGDSMEFVEVFNLATRELVGRAQLPNFATGVRPTRLVRFGTNGVALVNSANELYLVQGALIQ
jgi:hypothetical protein